MGIYNLSWFSFSSNMHKLVTALIKLACQHAYKVLICDVAKLYREAVDPGWRS
jgi:hypothetical protein